eukprot:TCALIF_03211-PB protein Name:"Protein of unknown function" AED:0.42 eAED:0.82 QI:0/0.5/0/1/0.5/0.66/3/0/57
MQTRSGTSSPVVFEVGRYHMFLDETEYQFEHGTTIILLKPLMEGILQHYYPVTILHR